MGRRGGTKGPFPRVSGARPQKQLGRFQLPGQMLLEKGHIPLLEPPLSTHLHSAELSAPGQGVDGVGAQVELNGSLSAREEGVVEFPLVHADHSLMPPPGQ